MKLKTNIYSVWIFIWVILLGFYSGFCVANASKYSFIPKKPEAPEFPKFKTVRFSDSDISDIKSEDSKEVDDNLLGVPALPKSWVFNKSFPLSSSKSFKMAYADIKALGVPIFALNCKKDRLHDFLLLQIGPYFDSSSVNVLNSFVSKIKLKYKNSSKEEGLVNFLKNMSVEKYNPVKCNFLQDEDL